MQLARSRGVRDANAKMECVERCVGARRKESVVVLL